ncbi:MAG: cadherin repeat domain-containing protein [Candidatus Hodarchaeales archaeon]
MSRKHIIAFAMLLLLAANVYAFKPITPVKAYPPGEISVWNTRPTSSTLPGLVITISCSFGTFQLSSYTIRLHWRVNGGDLNSKIMTENGNTASTTIGPFNKGDLVEYRSSAIGADTHGNLVYSYDPSASGFKSFTVDYSYSVSWTSPAAGMITFGKGTGSVSFTPGFTKSPTVDHVKLFFNGIDMGTVTSGNPVSFIYSTSFDGTVTAVLKGYDSGDSEVVSDQRTFTFRKIVSQDTEILLQNYKTLGEKLYLIVHDPSGDESVSSYETASTVSIGVGAEVTAGITTGLEFGVEESGSFFGLFKTGFEASTKLELSYEVSAGFDVRYEVVDSTFLSSSNINDNPDFIGPGYGDTYWGEAWELHWLITTETTTYYDGTTDNINGKMWYGILRELETIYGDQNAPQLWKNMNLVYDGYPDEKIDWITTLSADGGRQYTSTHEVSSTVSSSQSIEISFSSENRAKLEAAGIYVEATVEVSLSTKIYAEQQFSHRIETSYTIEDDDPTDHIVQRVGIDKRFGTYVFDTQEDTSYTSNPLEHYTKDYIPPPVGTPSIVLDADGDGVYPTGKDSPIITVPITDEGGIQDAVIHYTTDGGNNWYIAILEEQVGNPGTYEGTIPVMPHGTTVEWYIQVWDVAGNDAVKKNAQSENFSYTVVNRVPVITVLAPNGGETVSNLVTISWSASDPDNDELTYQVGYNLENQGWQLITSGLKDPSIVWDISGFADSSSVMIKVIANDGHGGIIEDTSDFIFSIDNEDAPAVSLLAPISGFTYKGILTIEWSLTDIDSLVTGFDLYYSNNSGSDWYEITSGLDKVSESFDWDTSSIVYLEGVKIKVITLYEMDGTPQEEEDISGLLTIDNRPVLILQLIHPNGGEVWEDQIAISWSITTDDLVKYSCTIEYSTNGVNWYVIASDIAETSYEWNTRDLKYGINYRVRITVTGSYLGYQLDTVTDVSEGSFTIDPDIEEPAVTGLNDAGYELGTVNNQLTWTLSDRNPRTYSIMKDGDILTEDEEWSNGAMTINIDGLSVGVYEYTIIVADIWGQTTTKTCTVTVVDTISPVVVISTPSDGEIFEIENEETDLSYSYFIYDLSELAVVLTLNDVEIDDSGLLENLKTGSYILNVTATDLYGNTANEAIKFFIVSINTEEPVFGVTVINPNGGDVVVKEILPISWIIANPFELETSYDLHFSSDGGVSWNLIIDNLETTSYQWNTSLLENSDKYLVKVTAKAVYEGKQLVSEDESDSTFVIVHSVDTEDLEKFESPGYTLVIALLSIVCLAVLSRKRMEKR